MSKGRKRSQRRGPVVGGLKERNTKEAKIKRAKKDAAEMAARVRKDIKLPTTKEVLEVERTKER